MQLINRDYRESKRNLIHFKKKNNNLELRLQILEKVAKILDLLWSFKTSLLRSRP